MNQSDAPTTRSKGDGWGPFTSRQLTTIVCVAIIAAVAIPTAAMAAVGTFTSTTATPAVTATNSSTAVNAKGVQGSATGTNTNARWGVTGNAGGANGIGVQGTGTKYGVFSNGPLGVAAGKSLGCTGCVPVGALSNAAGRARAYAYVHDDGTVNTSRSRNIQVTAHPQPAAYCVKVLNVDPGTIAPVVTASDTLYTSYVYVEQVTLDTSLFAGIGCDSRETHFVVLSIKLGETGGYGPGPTDFSIVIP